MNESTDIQLPQDECEKITQQIDRCNNFHTCVVHYTLMESRLKQIIPTEILNHKKEFYTIHEKDINTKTFTKNDGREWINGSNEKLWQELYTKICD